MKLLNYLVLSSLLLTACATPPQRVDSNDAAPIEGEMGQDVELMTDHDGHYGLLKNEIKRDLPNIELDSELLYDYLLAEIANQRGQTQFAVNTSSRLAEETQDPRLLERAARLALDAGDMPRAIENLKAWQKLEPESNLATRMLASVLLRGGKIDEAEPILQKMLQQSGDNIGITFLQISQMLSPHPDKVASLKLMQKLAAPYPEKGEAHWSVAHLAHQAGEEPLALQEIKLANKYHPYWGMAASLHAEILYKDQPVEAMDVLHQYLMKRPENDDVRLRYARMLMEQKQYSAARSEFLYLAERNVRNPELLFGAGIISLQLKEWDAAESQFRKLLDQGFANKSVVSFYLAQLSEQQEKPDVALIYYRDVIDGEYVFDAQIRQAYLLAQNKEYEHAHEIVKKIKYENNDERARLISLDAELLKQAGQLEQAYQVLSEGLQKLPKQTDLMYDAAMLLEKLGRFGEFDALLQQVIKLRPDLAHPYNALGYSWLERQIRIDEAAELIQKALQIAPDDVAIIDSMGWAYFRQGKYPQSIKMLRRAYELNQDPEIAAHLGEVLWVSGQQDEAKVIWQESLKLHLDAVFVKETMQRLMPK